MRQVAVRHLGCVFTAAVALMGCGSEPSERGAPPPALVRVAPVEAGALAEPWNAVGEVHALEDAALAVGSDGPVARVLVREGDTVARGDLLLELDLALVQAQWRAAQAAVEEAAAELARLEAALGRREAVGARVLGKEELEDAQQAVSAQRARVHARQAEVARVAAVMERQRLRAPFDGVITSRSADPGDWVRTGTPLLSLVSTGAVEVQVRVPVTVAQRLHAGDPVEVGGAPAKVVAVVPTLDASTRTALVRIAPDGAMVAGQAVDVTVPIQWQDRGVKVPRDALIADPEQARLVRVTDGKAEVMPVVVLVSTRTEALVEADGLSVGDVVVVRGNERVRPGQEVRIEGS